MKRGMVIMYFISQNTNLKYETPKKNYFYKIKITVNAHLVYQIILCVTFYLYLGKILNFCEFV